MSLFRKLSDPAGTESRSASLDEILRRLGIPLRSGGRTSELVSADRALRHGAVWSSVNLIADVVSGLPVDVYRGAGSSRTEISPPSLIVDPSADVLDLDWRRNVLVSWLLDGNAFGLVTEVDRAGWPRRIELLSAGSVRVRRENGRFRWKVGDRDRELWPVGDLWHAPAFTVPGQALGLSPITYAAESIGVGLAAVRFGAQWFTDGAHPTGLLETEQQIGPDVAKEVKRRFLDALGTSGREPVVLGSGLKFSSIQVSPEESQFLDTIRANVTDVERFFFGMPPEGSAGSSLTYANVEQRSLDLLTFGLSRWILRLERNLTRLIPAGQTVKLNTDALVRVDLLTRYRAHDVAVRSGWLSRNEVRELEDRPPIPAEEDGDAFLWPPYSTAPVAEAPRTDPSTVADS